MKLPAFQFYPGDWLRDPELQMASTISRGIWINALCRMWDAQARGKLSGTAAELARVCSCTIEEFELFLADIRRFKFANLTIRDAYLTLINRRMVRDEKARRDNANRQKRYYDNHKPNANLTATSQASSSSSSSSKKEKDTSLADARFGEFWELYRLHKAKVAAQKAWRKLNPDSTLIATILADLKTRFWPADLEKAPYPATYLNGRRWEDERTATNGAKPAPPAATAEDYERYLEKAE
jgi:hypothetical protein